MHTENVTASFTRKGEVRYGGRGSGRGVLTERSIVDGGVGSQWNSRHDARYRQQEGRHSALQRAMAVMPWHLSPVVMPVPSHKSLRMNARDELDTGKLKINYPIP